jgi:hypothetical protein
MLQSSIVSKVKEVKEMKMLVLYSIALVLATGCTIVPKGIDEQTVWKNTNGVSTIPFSILPRTVSYFAHIPREGLACLVIPLPKPQYVSVAAVRTENGRLAEAYTAVVQDKELSLVQQVFVANRDSNLFEKECAEALRLLPREAWAYFPDHWSIGKMSGVTVVSE